MKADASSCTASRAERDATSDACCACDVTGGRSAKGEAMPLRTGEPRLMSLAATKPKMRLASQQHLVAVREGRRSARSQIRKGKEGAGIRTFRSEEEVVFDVGVLVSLRFLLLHGDVSFRFVFAILRLPATMTSLLRKQFAQRLHATNNVSSPQA